MTEVIQGAKGGGSKPRPPREAPDSLVSIAYARIIDLVSEGEIEGLVDGEASIFLDETPGASGGALTFPSLKWDFRPGTQDQSHIPGFAQVENNISISTELRSDAPWVRSVTNLDLSALRINIAVPRLARQNTSNGDTNGYRINYAIDVAEGAGAFQEVLVGAFDGKTAGGYERSIRVDLPGRPAGGWRVRVRRLTANSESSAIADTTTITSITEIIDAKFRYPNSALVALEFDAETFGGSVPKRGYHMRGRIIRVPSNYDPATRLYTGVWDGTFKPAYSNNPAWVFYDLLLHPRYGLGERIHADQVDKWGLYQIGQYCDQLVPDGRGGMEPRFTCNLYLQKQADAYKALQDIAAIFRGITYWGAGQAVVSADMPADPVFTYTNANVIGGKFSYKGSKRSTRYSAALVSWNDPTDMYRAKVAYTQDDAAVARFGLQKVEITSVGCTSEGQALRAGEWAILTNLLEAEMVSFSVGLDGVRGRPGQIIRVADNARAGRRIGGRVSAATREVVTADRIDGARAGDELTCILPNGNAQSRAIESVDGNRITVAQAFDAAPVTQSVWAWESEELAAQRFRIVSISESGPLEYTITASKYVAEKHQAVDSGAIISQRPITSIPAAVQPAPQNIRAVSDWMIEQTMAVTTMTIMWDAPEGATRYDVEWRKDDGDWVFAGRVGTTEIEVRGIYAGIYQVRVRAINSLDVPSLWGYSEAVQLQGKTGEPPAVAFLNTAAIIFGIELKWGFPAGAEDTLRTEIRYNTNPTEQNALHLGDYAYPADTHTLTGLAAAQRFYFSARLVDRSGNVGPWSEWVLGQSSADADEILDYIAGQISETELAQHLREEIELISGVGPGSVNERIDEVSGEFGNLAGDIANLNNAVSGLNDQVGGLDNELQLSVSDLNNQISQLETQLADITGAADWDAIQAYLAGSLVRFEGSLYRAEQDVPAGTPVSDTTYWRKVGDYASIGEAVAALAIQVTDMQVQVDEITGAQRAYAETLNTLVASTRGQRADGDKADALRGWQTQASITQRDRVEASDKEALAQRLLVIDAQIGDTSAQLSTLEQAFASESEATAGRLDQLAVELGTTTADLQQEIQTRATETAALASDVQSMQAVLEGVATSEALQALVVEVEQLDGNITSVAQSVASLTGRIEDTETGLQVMSEAVSGLQTSVSNIEGELSAQASDITALGVSVGQAAALAGQADGKADEALQGLAGKADASAVQGLTVEVQQLGEDVSANSSSITQLGSSVQTAQQTADDALAGLTGKADASALQSLTTDVQQVGEDVSANTGAITELGSRVDSAESGIAGNADAVEALTTEVSEIDGKVEAAAEQASRLSVALRPSRADGDKADALRGYQSQASIAESRRVTATEAEASAERDLLLQSQLTDTAAALLVEQETRATADSALAEQAVSMRAQIDDVSATVGQVDTASVSRDEALGQRASTIEARMPTGSGQLATSASVQAVQQAVADESAARASDVSTLQASIATVSGEASAAQSAADQAAQAAAAAAGIAEGKGKVLIQSATPAVADRQTQNLWIDTTGGANTPKRWAGSSWQPVTDKAATDAAAAAAAAQDVAEEALQGVADNAAAVQQANQAIADEVSARASAIQTVQAEVGTVADQAQAALDAAGTATDAAGQAAQDASAASAAVQQVSQAVAALEGNVSTMWSVRMQVNQAGQYVYAGIGLGIENGPGGLQSQFLVEANRFALLNTIDGETTVPFVVEGGQTIINSAVIKQADIINLIVTGVLQSPDYAPGMSGIRLNFVTGEFELNGSVPGQGRTTTTNRATKVYDGNGVLRVQLGDLDA